MRATKYYFDNIIGPFKALYVKGPGKSPGAGYLYDLHRPRAGPGYQDRFYPGHLSGMVHRGKSKIRKRQ